MSTTSEFGPTVRTLLELKRRRAREKRFQSWRRNLNGATPS